MFYISLKDLLEYVTCPRRLLFSVDKYQENFSDLRNDLARKLLFYGFSCVGRQVPISANKLSRRLGALWDGVANQYPSSITEKVNLKNCVIRTNNYIENHVALGYEPVSIGLNLELRVGAQTVVYDDSALLLHTEIGERTLKGVYALSSRQTSLNINHFYVQLAHSFIYHCVRKDFYRNINNTQAEVLLLGSTVTYSPAVRPFREVREIFQQISTSMQEDRHPRPDKITCGYCPYSKSCNWNCK